MLRTKARSHGGGQGISEVSQADGARHAALGTRCVADLVSRPRRQARAAGLLAGEKSAHVSFRAPPALIEAAKREAGVDSTTELGLLALVLLAQPDPVVSAMRKTRGRLGRDHQLDD